LVQGRSWPSAVAHSRGLAGELKVIAALLQRAVIEKILTRLGLGTVDTSPLQRPGAQVGLDQR